MGIHCPVSDGGELCSLTVSYGSALEFAMNDTLATVNSGLRYSFSLFIFESVIFGMATTTVLLSLYASVRWQRRMVVGNYRLACIFCAYIAISVHWGFNMRCNSKITGALSWGGIIYSGYEKSTAEFGPGVQFDHGGYAHYFKELTCEAVLSGVLCVHFLIALSMFLKGRPERKNPSHRIPLLLVPIMLCASLGHLIWLMESRILQVLSDDSSEGDGALGLRLLPSNTSLAIKTLFAITMLCGDIIVLWRASAVWMHRIAVRRIAMTLLSTTVGFTAWELSLISRVESMSEENGAFTSMPGAASISLSCLSNIFSTSAIICQAWIHRRRLRSHFAFGSRRLLTERILAVSIETGIVYTIFWVVFIYTASLDGNFDLFGSVSVDMLGDGGEFSKIYGNAIIQIVAIYPTAIIILVMTEKTAYANNAVATRPSRISLPAIPLTLATIIQTAPSEFIVIGETDSRSCVMDSKQATEGDDAEKGTAPNAPLRELNVFPPAAFMASTVTNHIMSIDIIGDGDLVTSSTTGELTTCHSASSRFSAVGPER